MHQLRLARRNRLTGLPERVILVTTPPDGAHHATIREDEHFCADALGCRPMCRHDGHERCWFASIERLRNGGEDLRVHLLTIIEWRRGRPHGKARTGRKGGTAGRARAAGREQADTHCCSAETEKR